MGIEGQRFAGRGGRAEDSGGCTDVFGGHLGGEDGGEATTSPEGGEDSKAILEDNQRTQATFRGSKRNFSISCALISLPVRLYNYEKINHENILSCIEIEWK